MTRAAFYVAFFIRSSARAARRGREFFAPSRAASVARRKQDNDLRGIPRGARRQRNFKMRCRDLVGGRLSSSRNNCNPPTTFIHWEVGVVGYRWQSFHTRPPGVISVGATRSIFVDCLEIIPRTSDMHSIGKKGTSKGSEADTGG